MELYIHIPFCVRKCLYCDFLSFAADETTREKYVQELLREIYKKAPDFSMHEITSVFFGGGTPTVLDGERLAEIMDQLRDNFNIRSDAEISIECNPGTVDYKKLCELRDAGFNRISIGLQSASDEELVSLGRIHSWNQFKECFRNAREAGFRNINVDVISSIPGQSVESYKNTLESVVELSPEHISAYSLIVEEGTPFFEKYAEADELRREGKFQNLLPTEDDEREMYRFTQSVLKNAGYSRYEISNYAKAGKECKHNLGYWTGEEYLGLGLGASSLVSGVRFKNTDSLENYLKGDFSRYEEMLLSAEDEMAEYMMLRLRLTRGIELRDFKERFGKDIDDVWPGAVSKLVSQGLVEARDGQIFLTERGLDLNNQVILEFV